MSDDGPTDHHQGEDPWHHVQVERDGVVLDVRVAGPADGEPVVLLHGFPQTSRCWTALARLLTADRAEGEPPLLLLAPDQRGCSPGARPADVAAYALDELVADALAVVAATGHEAAHLVGHDWGSSVAWALAGRHPERVRSLLAVSLPHPAAYAVALRDDPDQQARSAYLRDFRAPAPGPEETLLADDAARLRAIWGDDVPAVQQEADLAVLRDGALHGGLNWYRAMRRDIAETPDVVVPTTYVWGTEDTFAGEVAARRCGEHVRADYRFVPLPGVGHWVPDREPQVLAAELRARVTQGVRPPPGVGPAR